MARNKHYYFKLRNGVEYAIKETAIEINTLIMRMYRELTDEQREFYLAHPTASVQEVVNCQLTPPYVPPTPDVQEYAVQRVRELKEACYAAMGVTSLEYAMAIDKVENITADSFYSLTEAKRVVADFRTQSKKAMTVLSTYRQRMEAATSIENVDEIYNQAIEAL